MPRPSTNSRGSSTRVQYSRRSQRGASFKIGLCSVAKPCRRENVIEMTFSRRHGFATEQSPILNDAPRWLRLEYWTRVLEPRLFVEGRGIPSTQILGTMDLHTSFCTLVHADPKPEYLFASACKVELREHLLNCEWFEFYDLVELVASKTHDYDYNAPF